VQREPQLLEIVPAGRPPRRFPGRLHGRQEQAHKRADDRDHDQQFDQRKCTPATRDASSATLALHGQLHCGSL
jgi:hypothetical protein